MEFKEYNLLLQDAFAANSIEDLLNEEKSERLFYLSKSLIETNKSFNLTAITEPKEIILKHFVDCASVSKHIPHSSSIIDIGCGAGFPSLPLAILREDITVTSIDSTGKKIDFINKVSSSLSLSNIFALISRAEDFAKKHREEYDISISRAVARLNILSELCLPLVKPNGKFIAMKSSKGEEEYSEAKSGISKLGAELEFIDKQTLRYGESEIERKIYIFVKGRKTPSVYPRNYSQIVKKPL